MYDLYINILFTSVMSNLKSSKCQSKFSFSLLPGSWKEKKREGIKKETKRSREPAIEVWPCS
jgi:hypothetical protein